MESKTRLLRKRKAALLRLKKYHQPVTEANHNRDQDGCSITATNAALGCQLLGNQHSRRNLSCRSRSGAVLILFLDIDGVLVTWKQIHSHTDRHKFDPQCVSVLNSLLSAVADVRIVVSSSWRIFHPLEELQEIFSDNGVNHVPIDVTPVELNGGWPHSGNGRRGAEIRMWLLTNGDPEFLIIDDETCDIHPYFHRDRIVSVRHGMRKNGIEQKHVDRALRLLQKQGGLAINGNART